MNKAAFTIVDEYGNSSERSDHAQNVAQKYNLNPGIL